MGLLTVASLLPPEWELRFIDSDARPPGEADWQWADLVFLSGMINHRDGVLALTQEIKQRGKTLVVGGTYATVLPDEVLGAGADFVVRGEGETAIPLLLEALAEGRPGRVIEAPGKPELSSSPAPRYDLVNFHDYNCLGVQTCRGCPHDCEFCDVTSLFGRRVRVKTVAQVLAELDSLFQLGWQDRVFFTDDNFIGNRAYAKKLLKELISWNQSRGEPFSFWTQTSLDLGREPELIDLMTRANFATVFIGIESADAAALSRAGKRQNLREPLVQSLNTITANGLTVMGSVILGMDGEEPGAGARLAELVEAASLPQVMINLLVALPNSPFWHRLSREGRLLSPRGNLDSLLPWPTFVASRPGGQVLQEYLELWDRLYEPKNFLERTTRYYLQMRPTRAALGQAEEKLPVTVRRPRLRLTERLRGSCFDLYSFLILIWRWSWQRGLGREFLARFREIRRKNPTRWRKFLVSCFWGEDLMRLREIIRRKYRDYLGQP
jgi:radical SAM superfamily enzyme YgiQ (UPF0313 family)